MKIFLTIAAGFLLTIGGSHATPPPTGTVYRVVQVNSAGVIVSLTNFSEANGLSTTGAVAGVQAAASSAMATSLAAKVSIEGHLTATNPHAITPAMIGGATSNQGVLAETAVQPGDAIVSTSISSPDAISIEPADNHDLSLRSSNVSNPGSNDDAGDVLINGGNSDNTMGAYGDGGDIGITAGNGNAAGDVTITAGDGQDEIFSLANGGNITLKSGNCTYRDESPFPAPGVIQLYVATNLIVSVTSSGVVVNAGATYYGSSAGLSGSNRWVITGISTNSSGQVTGITSNQIRCLQ